jgi:hypothetical protein
VTDFLDSKRREINDRLAELKPLIDEYNQLEAASKALAGVPPSKNGAAAPAAGATSVRRRGPGRPRGSKSKTASASTVTRVAAKSTAKPAGRHKVGRRKGSGKRSTEALALIQAQPGITIAELGGKMGIKQNYLYRVLPTLAKEKKIKKQGRAWHPAK